MKYQYEEFGRDYLDERHLLEDPEYHEKVDPDTGEGTGEPDDPHCDWCWQAWPCEVRQMLIGETVDMEQHFPVESPWLDEDICDHCEEDFPCEVVQASEVL